MSSPTPKLVTIVVPVFNVEDLVGPCVESILAQTYRRLEILLVDDGSTDSSGRLVDAFAARDDRVIAIHKPNGGLSDARNVAIDQACGDYIVCVDGDDVITPDHIESLVAAATQSEADVAVAQFRRVDPVAAPPRTATSDDYGPAVLGRDEALEELFYQRSITTSAWGKLYARALFEGIRYPVGELQEDLPVTWRLLARASRIAVVDAQTYLYVQRGGSITSQRMAERRLKALDFAGEALDYMREHLPHLVGPARCRLLMEAVYITGQASSTRDAHRISPRISGVLRENRWGVLRDERAPKVQRLFALASYGGAPTIRLVFACMFVASTVRRRMSKG